VAGAGNDPDVLVIGSGPNGLAAALEIARAGRRVLVLEAHPERIGGAVGTGPLTGLEGFHHDVGAAFFPFGTTSPALKDLGIPWRFAPIESAHPARDGSVGMVTRSPLPEGAPDRAVWNDIQAWYQTIQEPFLQSLLGPFPTIGPALGLGPARWIQLALAFATSGRGLSERWFRTEASRRVLPALALHVDAGPDDTFGAGIGLVLGLQALTGGFPVPEGGARTIADIQRRHLEEKGGSVRIGARVKRIVVTNERATAVVLEDGSEVPAREAILADTGAPALYLGLLEGRHQPVHVRRRMERFPYGFGTFKMDWALSSPVPWRDDTSRKAAVVHAGESVDDLARFTKEVRDGKIPTDPYLVIGQQSLADPTRAPLGKATLWAYSRVPFHMAGGWDEAKRAFADAIETRIEALAPGFRASILGRAIHTPEDLEKMDENLVGGDIAGGSNAWYRQLVFRPVFPYFRYRTPVRRLYLCSSYAHPGAGVHGMCGFNAARLALQDLG
jgi:phytoene dehydrogenase-like protein